MNALSTLAQTTLLTFTLLGATTLQASVIINSTRVVYPQNDKEVTVRLESKNQAPVLVQTWLDKGDEHSTSEQGDIPFVVTPPIFRMEPGKQQVMRVAYTGEPLPTTQESLFWFNLLEVPAQPPGAQTGNQLQLAFRSRIKLFYRPHNLAYGVQAAPGKLQWRRVSNAQGQGLEVFNPTPYHVTFEAVEVLDSGQRHARKTASPSSANMVVPGGRLRFELPTLNSAPSATATVQFQTLDDYGVKIAHSAKVPP